MAREVQRLFGSVDAMARKLDEENEPEMREALEMVMGILKAPATRKRPAGTGSAFDGSDDEVDEDVDGDGGVIERATFDLSRMSFATGELTAPASSGSFWECGRNLAFRM